MLIFNSNKLNDWAKKSQSKVELKVGKFNINPNKFQKSFKKSANSWSIETISLEIDKDFIDILKRYLGSWPQLPPLDKPLHHLFILNFRKRCNFKVLVEFGVVRKLRHAKNYFFYPPPPCHKFSKERKNFCLDCHKFLNLLSP